MLTIQIREDELIEALERAARQNKTTVDELAKDALLSYIQSQPAPKRVYSFIGIGHSGKGTISVDAEEILIEAANRREGWSMAE